MAWFLSLVLSSSLSAGDGYDFLEKGKPLYARTAFRNQLRKRPSDSHMLIGLGIAELALGNPEAATPPLLEGLRAEPNRADARRSLAQCMLLRAQTRAATGRNDDTTHLLLLDAADQAQRARSLDPSHATPYIVLAQTHIALGDLVSAEETLSLAEQRGIAEDSLRELRGEIRSATMFRKIEEVGDLGWEEAVELLEPLVESSPESVTLRLRLGDVHHIHQRWHEALDAYGEALQLDPFQRVCAEVVLTYLPFDHLREHAKRVLEATAKLATKQATRKDPRPGFSIYCVGVAHLWNRDYAEATTAFEEALERDPSLEIPAHLGIADAAFRENDYERSSEAYLLARRADPDEALARIAHLARPTIASSQLQFLGQQRFDAKALGDARDLLGFALALNPEEVPLLNNYAFLCRETKQFEESADAYLRLIELRPTNPRFLNDTALVLHYHLKKNDQARRLYQRAIDEGRRIIDDPATVPDLRTSAQEAVKDARDNLQKLNRGK